MTAIHQDLVVPKEALNLQFHYRAGWDMITFTGSTLPREFYVDIEPSGGGGQNEDEGAGN